MSTRVFELARELEVDSKAVLKKCRAEGLDIKNHMSTLSAGQVATIREWFTAGANVTAVEEAEHVDLEKARRTARRKKKKVEEETPEAEAAEAATAVEEAPAETPAAEEPAPPDAEVVVAVEEPQVEAAPEVPATETPAGDESPEVAAESPVVEEVPEVGEELKKPAKPAYEPAKNIPAPAELKGPKVIRVERPEPDAMARPRGPRPPRPARPAAGGGPPEPADATATRSPRRRGGVAAEASPAPEGETDDKSGKGGKRRTRSPRRSARSEAIERVREWRDQDLLERKERLAQATGRLRTRRSDEGHQQFVASRPTQAEVEEPVMVKELSAAIAVKSTEIIRKLMASGVMATMNQRLEPEAAISLAAEFGVELTVHKEKSPQDRLADQFRKIDRKSLQSRPPVVTFLGHVDHGKTSLLDRIRHAHVTEGEAGGITQHIGAYRYHEGGRDVVFLDTPGHEAFTQLRSRGANMTDVVVLVVAADDGVMPQTVEAINHAKAAGVPIVVALNKIDRPNANPDRVYGQLAEQGLSPREWGGSTEVVRTSATTGEGVDSLVELLSLEAELLELKADPTIPATGTIIEAERDPARGVTARALVQEGTLKVGDVLVCGPSFGRVRSLTSDKGADVRQAGPATPVAIAGLDEVPDPGDKFYVISDLSEAKDMAEKFQATRREKELFRRQAVTLENLFSRISAGETRELPLIVKADVQGSIEVLIEQLGKLSTEEVKVRILHAAVGAVVESDVLLATASDAVIVGFHVAVDDQAQRLANERGVQIRQFRIIYELTDSVRKALEGMLSPEIREKVMGTAEVRETFKVSRIGTIAGCLVIDGVIQRSNKIRLIREGIVVQEELSMESLRRFKDDAREVRAGLECGIKLAGYDDLKLGDRLQAWTTEEVARTL